MIAFDINRHPVTAGTHSLEASAGTGKTFSLVGMIIRLVVEEDFRLPSILAVTFTRKATGELGERLREKLSAAAALLEDEDSPVSSDPQFAFWQERIEGNPALRKAYLTRVRIALAEADNASVFTIHGFCRRVLTECAFESGLALDLDMDDAGAGFTTTAARDFLRELYAPLLSPESGYAETARFIYDVLGIDGKWLLELAKQISSGGSFAFAALETAAKKPAVKAALDRFYDERDSGLAALKQEPGPDRMYALMEPLVSELARIATLDGAKGAVGAAEKSLADFIAVVFEARFAAMLEKIKVAAGALTFDDLIRKTAAALENAETGERLAARLRERYKVALIDEFQDTDLLQTAIFTTVFEGLPLLFIGDPKQSIYRFRGADIGAYEKTVGAPGVTHAGLETNYRSTPEMVDAANALFADDDGIGKPGLFPSGAPAFRPVTAGAENVPALSDGNGNHVTALTVVWTEGGSPETPVKRKTAENRFCRDLAGRIAGILRDHTLGGVPVKPSDIAVLVASGRQGEAVQAALRAEGVPASRTAGSVFGDTAALALRRLLAAMISPRRTPVLRAALAGPIVGLDAGKIRETDTDEAGYTDHATAFAEASLLWEKSGVIAAVTSFMTSHAPASAMLARADGERLLADLRQLLELAHEEERAAHHSPQSLLAWLDAEILSAEGSGAPDENRQRLESDGDSVSILTMHMAKGLEFPVVFVPFAWKFGSGGNKAAFVSGSPDGIRRVAVKGNHAALESLGEKELFAEQARLLYVAVTRAKSACFLYTGLIANRGPYESWTDGIWNTPLGTLAPCSGIVTSAKAKNPEPERVSLLEGWMRFAEKHAGCVSVEKCVSRRAAAAATEHFTGAVSREIPSARRFAGMIDRDRISSSYSGLTRALESGAAHRQAIVPVVNVSHRVDEIITPALTDPAEPVSPKNEIRPAEKRPADNIFNFPRGATVGDAVHGLLEEQDFTRPVRIEVVRTALRRNGLDEARWGDVLRERADAWLATPLKDADGSDFTLNEIAPGDRLSEMGFDLRAAFRDGDALADALELSADGRRLAETIGALRAAVFPGLDGYLTGFIDLVFRRDGRYYILDWKTNHLGDDFDAYAQPALESAMSEHRYHLQYHFYLVALDAHLRSCLGDAYEPGRHLGGVLYLFVRGLDPARPGSGVFAAKAEPAVIAALSRAVAGTPPPVGSSSD